MFFIQKKTKKNKKNLINKMITFIPDEKHSKNGRYGNTSYYENDWMTMMN